MKNLILISTTLLITLFLTNCEPAPVNYLDEKPEAFDARMEWWRDARFGMFIHWGVYSVPAGVYKGEDVNGIAEWIMFQADIPVEEYEKYPPQFNPTKFDAREWVRIAKDAGMKYIVITSKHHDGFSMWDSETSDYNIVDATPYDKDVLKELARECETAGIKLCFYHSILDWHHPLANEDGFSEYRETYLKPQLKELLTEYGDIGVLWFDGEWIPEWTEAQGKQLYNYVRSFQPDIIINNRVGKGRKGMQGMNKDGGYAGDFGTPEQEILETASDLDWESCMTMNSSWGFKKSDDNWKSAEVLIHNLVDIAAKGGNYLLNVGPNALGEIPVESVERLAEMGEWMDVNGEAIYGTNKFDAYMEQEIVRYTQKGAAVYTTFLEWPGETFTLKYVQPEKNSKILLLGYDQALDWVWIEEKGLTITFPKDLQKETNRPTKYAWTLKMHASVAEVVELPVISSPRIENAKKELFGDEIEIKLSTSTTDAKIHYTLNGKTPDNSSPVYEQPIVLKESTVVKTFAEKAGVIDSPVTHAEFIRTNKFKSLDLKSEISPNYPALGKLSLSDNVRASTDFHDGNWLGFEGNDFEVVIDLGEERAIKKIRTGFLQNIGSWIFHPQKLEYLLSDDGVTYTSVYLYKHTTVESDEDVINDFSFKARNKKAHFLKIKATSMGTCPEWHGGAGGKAWLFVDEVMVE
jgi:alpha-L-fucosidase